MKGGQKLLAESLEKLCIRYGESKIVYPTPTNSEGISKLKNEPPHEIIDNMDIEIDFILPLNAIKQYILELEWPVAEEENDVQKSSSPDDLIVKYRAVVLPLTAEMKNCIMSRKSHLMNYIGNLLSEAINSPLPFQSNDLCLLFNENQSSPKNPTNLY